MPTDKAKERRMKKDFNEMFDYVASTEMKLDVLRYKAALKSSYVRSNDVKMLRESLRLAKKRRLRDYVC